MSREVSPTQGVVQNSHSPGLGHLQDGQGGVPSNHTQPPPN